MDDFLLNFVPVGGVRKIRLENGTNRTEMSGVIHAVIRNAVVTIANMVVLLPRLPVLLWLLWLQTLPFTAVTK